VHENVLRVKNVDELWSMLRDRTGRPGYKANYGTEADFEADVWKRVIGLARDLGLDVERSCLTSHAIHRERSASAWREFLREPAGPDVKALGSHNRLDVVLRHPSHGSIGIEVKCLGPTGHAGKLTQALGQALLGLWHRDRVIVIIHSGTVSADTRSQLRNIGTKVCNGTKMALVVVP
jgi:hypothetical protein